jgi:hypothetical protein
VFSIGLNEREQPLIFIFFIFFIFFILFILIILIKIQSFFGIGNIYLTAANKRAVHYSINRNVQLVEIIINHFDSYPLIGAKQSHY